MFNIFKKKKAYNCIAVITNEEEYMELVEETQELIKQLKGNVKRINEFDFELDMTFEQEE